MRAKAGVFSVVSIEHGLIPQRDPFASALKPVDVCDFSFVVGHPVFLSSLNSLKGSFVRTVRCISLGVKPMQQRGERVQLVKTRDTMHAQNEAFARKVKFTKSVPHTHELKKARIMGYFLEDLGFARHLERVGNGGRHGFGKEPIKALCTSSLCLEL